MVMCCILFHFYIKPQLRRITCLDWRGCILFHFYIKPQLDKVWLPETYVVSYSISTSNHNNSLPFKSNRVLYLIPFLHQTTTGVGGVAGAVVLYLIPFLHQTTTFFLWLRHRRQLYLIPFLHQTTT